MLKCRADRRGPHCVPRDTVRLLPRIARPVVLGLAVAHGAVAQTPHVGLTLDAAIDSALRHNPDALVARSAADSAEAERRIARALPNPMLAGVPNTPYQYSATIALDVGPQRVYRVRASTLGWEAAQADLRDNRRQLVLAVQRAYYDVLLADAVRRIVRVRQDVVRQLAAADSARVRAGDLPERALMRSEVELLRTEADAARAAIGAQTARLTIGGLMGTPRTDTALVLAGDLAVRDEVLRDTSAVLSGTIATGTIATRPDVLASRTRVAQARAAEGYSRSLVFPVPQLSIVRQYSAPFESGRYTSLGLGFELPAFTQYAGQRQRALASVQAADAQRRRVESQAEREARAALATLLAQRALVRRYEAGVVARVEANTAATRYAYAHGAAALIDVLDAVRAQQDVMTDYYTALHDYWVARYTAEASRSSS